MAAEKKRKRSSTSPTARSLAWLKKNGWVAGVVEKWIPQTRQRKDLWGWCDIVAFRHFPRDGICSASTVIAFIQVTSSSNVAARVKKIQDWGHLHELLCEPRPSEPDGCFQVEVRVHGWSKKGARGARKLWTLRDVDVWPGREVEP